ncbi:MAG: hypothetical protein KIS92_03070 [Planctomycetota bacterium]|nr:hypothetical protein [Planctomycetota bacterium]
MFNTILAKLLGIDRLEGGQIDKWSIHWANLKTPFQVLLFLVAAAVSVGIVWWFYKREPDYCTRKRKIIMSALRAGGIFILLIILAQPVLQVEKSGVAKSKVVILVDTSKSMTRVDKYATDADKVVAAQTLNLLPLNETDARKIPASAEDQVAQANRMDMVRAMFKHPEMDLLNKLKREYDVDLWTFSRAGEMANVSGGVEKLDASILEGIQAEGVATEIGGALRATTNKYKGQPLAGVVLVTDGGFNKGEEPTLVASDMPVRVFPVGIGVPEARDVAVSSVFMDSKIFLDDPAPVTVRLKHHGFPDEQVQLVITMGGEELARQPVTLKKGGEQTEVVRIKPKKAGKFPITIEVPAPAGDTEPSNNIKERTVEVIDKKVKVLVLESSPRWEYRYLSTALLRDKRVECKLFLKVPDLNELATPGSPFIKEFPEKEELFKYDVIVFGNMPNDSSWTEAQLENIRRFVVQEGGGIWFIAGKNNMPDSYKDSKIDSLIPVEFDRAPETTAEDEKNSPLTEGFRLVLTPEGKTHSLTRLDAGVGGTDEDNAGRWEMMPELFWYHKANRAKLNASVLLIHGGEAEAAQRGGPPPILVTAQNGRGRVLYSAIDQFWRMRYPAEMGPEALERFYGHAVQYLGLAHCLGGSPRIEINTDAEEYAVGDKVKVTARILNKDTYDPSTQDHFAALATDLANDANTLPFDLTPEPNQKGIYRGDFIAKEQGSFRIALKDETEEGAYKDINVRIPQIEMDQPDMKKELLDNIAKASVRGPSENQARCLLSNQAGELIKDLKESQRKLEVRIEDPLWDAPLFVILFTLFMGAEWFIRKRSDLC